MSAEPAPVPDVSLAEPTVPPVDGAHTIDSQQAEHAISKDSNQPPAGEEQALESHEVIELQAFSERKAWIEEKIKVIPAITGVSCLLNL